MNNIDLVIILSTAFLGSVGHCIGMCGGIVVAYSSSKIDQKDSWAKQTIAHLSYNFGRVTTYAMLGAVFGLLGKAIAFTPTTKGVLFLLTGVLMILAGLSLLGNLKFLNSAEWSVSKNAWYQNAFRKLISSKSLPSFYLLGMLNGIIPLWFGLLFCHHSSQYSKPTMGCYSHGNLWFGNDSCSFLFGEHHQVPAKRFPSRDHDETGSHACCLLRSIHYVQRVQICCPSK